MIATLQATSRPPQALFAPTDHPEGRAPTPYTRTGALDVVVLAAGRGSRLGHLGEETPKWLLDVGGTTIAARQLAGIAAARARTIRVVTGHAPRAIDRFAAGRPELCLVHSPRYADRNKPDALALVVPEA